jgi:effector-binding domain-containing protein
MLDAPTIVRTIAHSIAVIRFTVPRSQIEKVMGPGLRELKDAVAAQAIASVGPWFTHHLRMAPAVFDFEIGVPVATPIAAAVRVLPSEFPAATMARTVCHGGYEGLGDAWGECDAWIAAAPRDTRRPRISGSATSWAPSRARPRAACRTELSRPLLP